MAVTFRNLQVDRLLRAVPEQALERYGAAVWPVLQQKIVAKDYRWPRQTIRYGGGYKRTVSSPRDIVDSTRLLRSQTQPAVSASDRGSVMRISWPARNPGTGDYYSLDVLIGVPPGDPNGLPGRDWIGAALEELPPREFLVQEYRALAGT